MSLGVILVWLQPNVGAPPSPEVLEDTKYSSEIKTLQHLISLKQLHYLARKRGQAKLKDLISIFKSVLGRE